MNTATETKLSGEDLRLVQCDNCGHVSTFYGLLHKVGDISNLLDRVDIGGEMPAGECPECDCLTYLIKDEPVAFAPADLIEEVQMTEDEWLEKFQPIKNPFESRNGAWDDCLFETYGEELELVFALSNTNSLRIWTLIEVDGKQYIAQGYQHVNRLGYFITAVPADKMLNVEVEVEDLTEDEDFDDE